MTAIRGPLVLLLVASALCVGPAWADGNERGEDLFDLCAQCHGADAGGRQPTLAPAIAGLPLWYVQASLEKFRNGGRGTHFDDIAGMRMRPMSLSLRSEEDVTAVSEYVASLPVVKPLRTFGGDATKGKLLYGPCTACHGVDGSGNEALKAPPIANQSDWYMRTAIKAFQAGVRGTNPNDASGALMRPMSMLLADDQKIEDAIAYITSLSSE